MPIAYFRLTKPNNLAILITRSGLVLLMAMNDVSLSLLLSFSWTIRLNNEQLAKRLEKLSHSYFLFNFSMFLHIHCFPGMHAVHHRKRRFYSNDHACTFLNIWLCWMYCTTLHTSYVAYFTTRSYRRFVILWSLNVPNGLFSFRSVCCSAFYFSQFSILKDF